MKFVIVITLALIFTNSKAQTSQGLTCSDPIRFCDQPIIVNAVTIGYSAPLSTNYGCLGSQLNPLWFYQEIATSGDMTYQISSGSDIDFVCWGPFDSVNFCNTYDTASIVDCSFSGTSTETMVVQNAIAGKYYLFMVTNSSGQAQNIAVNQSSGIGQVYCNSNNLIGAEILKSIFISNPVVDKLIVKSKIPIKTLTLSDVLGAIKLKYNTFEEKNEIDVTQIESGIYFLSIETEFGFHTRKIIKN